ncbi:627_t:CDS:2 [Ambispora leptoticha]|uniref:627_t:CDS:1 n=1 Tax=Ambispora leptoticha TaxID=144679 RepID=A0A9N9I3V6_9GLOM|nr:627_t:CDS:2 [Ambispora leptoticha]
MVEWTDTQIRILIDERRNRNEEYHNFGRNRIGFWNSIATRINQEHNTSFNGHQCKEKFSNLVRDYNSMCDYMAGNRRARRSRTGAQYFNEFRTHFWERPKDDFDRIRNINSSNRRQRRIGGNNTPTPSTGEVEHVLGRRSQRQTTFPPLSHDAININTNNPEQNISIHPPPIETLSPQLPPYGATDGAQNNNKSSEMNQRHVVSSHEVADSGNNLTPNLLNISSSENDSGISMHDEEIIKNFYYGTD